MDADNTAPAPAEAAPAPANDGMVSISQAEFDQYKQHETDVTRYQQNVAGLKPWQEGAQAAGFNSPPDL